MLKGTSAYYSFITTRFLLLFKLFFSISAMLTALLSEFCTCMFFVQWLNLTVSMSIWCIREELALPFWFYISFNRHFVCSAFDWGTAIGRLITLGLSSVGCEDFFLFSKFFVTSCIRKTIYDFYCFDYDRLDKELLFLTFTFVWACFTCDSAPLLCSLIMLDRSLFWVVISFGWPGEVYWPTHFGISRWVKVPKSSGTDSVFWVSLEFYLEFCV